MKIVSKTSASTTSSSKPIFRLPIKTANNKYEGSQYAVKVSGGFQISDPTKTMHVHTVPNVAKYDITDALQIAFPAKVLNSLLSNNQICISSQTLLEHLMPEHILSFGIFENLYTNYESFVNGTLGHVFSNTCLFCAKHPPFDQNSFYDLLTCNSITQENGNALSGEIRILDVERTLENLQKWNIFGNRTMDMSTNEFIRGDFFFMNEGFSITLKTDLSIQSTYISLIDTQNTCTHENIWTNMSTKTYTGNVLMYLI